MHAENFERFMSTYAEKLAEVVREKPEEYAYPVDMVPTVVAKMRAAIERGSFNHDGFAFRRTCKALGLSYTRKAIVAFVTGTPYPQQI